MNSFIRALSFILKICLAALASAYTSGYLFGLIEACFGYEVVFGSFLMIITSALLGLMYYNAAKWIEFSSKSLLR